MIIWRGLGILVIVVGVVAIMAGLSLAEAIGLTEMGLAMALAFAALGNWGLWKMIVPKKPRVLWDPATGEYVTLKSKHSLFFIPARFWTWIFLFLALPATVMGGLDACATAEDMKLPGGHEFKAANELLAKSENRTSNGNSAESKKAATSFSSAIKTLVDVVFVSDRGNPSTGRETDFPTFCQDSPAMIVFLCRVPELSKYKSTDAKDSLAKMAWIAANRNLEKLDPEKKKTVIVGLRDYSSYELILRGKAGELVTPDRSTNLRGNRLFFPAFAIGQTH